jgi:hypothetical protein
LIVVLHVNLAMTRPSNEFPSYSGLLPVGVTDEMALGWAPFDGIAFGFVGVIGLGSAVVLVNRHDQSEPST